MKGLLDHIAFAADNLAATYEFIETALLGHCGKRDGCSGKFTGMFAASYYLRKQSHMKVEIIAPPLERAAGEKETFMDLFLKRFGPGFHHMTFTVGFGVEDLRKARTVFERTGFSITGNSSCKNPFASNLMGCKGYKENVYGDEWSEFFVSPKNAPGGVLVQIATPYFADYDRCLEYWESKFPERRSRTFNEPATVFGPVIAVRRGDVFCVVNCCQGGEHGSRQ